MSNIIQFNNEYPKLWGQRKAKLLEVLTIDLENISEDLKEYDLKKSDGSYYNLVGDIFIQLIFIGNKNIPFCTFRSFTSDKYVELYNKIGEDYDLEVTEI